MIGEAALPGLRPFREKAQNRLGSDTQLKSIAGFSEWMQAGEPGFVVARRASSGSDTISQNPGAHCAGRESFAQIFRIRLSFRSTVRSAFRHRLAISSFV